MNVYNLIICGLLCLNSTDAYGQKQSSEKVSGKYKDASTLINVWLAAQRDYENIPFISGVVVKDQAILWSGAFGEASLDKAMPSNINTSTSICSTSKVFTATAIMKLVDEGKISLDDKVSELLPDYTVIQKYPKSGPITVRSLLTHTSGLPRDTEHAYWSGPDHNFPTKDELLTSLSTLETQHPVGEKALYSNIGFALLGLIIEEVSNQTYKQFMETEIFQPLDMTHSVVEMQPSLYGREHAIGYTAINRNGKRNRANFYQTKAMQPATGISTSALDMAKFAQWQFRLDADSDPEIISPAALNAMYQVQPKPKLTHNKQSNSISRGLGYEVFSDEKGSQWAMHGGICPGYVNFLKIDVTSTMAYAILVNANRVRAASYVNGLIDIFKRAEAISTPVEHQNTHTLNETETGSNKTNLNLSEYTGFYNLNPWNSEYYVAQWGDELVLMYLPAQPLKYALHHYQHVENDTFQLIENGKKVEHEFIKFIRDEHGGNVTKVKNGGNYHSRVMSNQYLIR